MTTRGQGSRASYGKYVKEQKAIQARTDAYKKSPMPKQGLPGVGRNAANPIIRMAGDSAIKRVPVKTAPVKRPLGRGRRKA
jgi:hypothetical protein